MDGLARLPPLRETIAAHGLDARKRLGQHFLLDLNLTRRIARAAAPLAAGTVIEVGPGPGGLTRALLLEGATHVVAIEVDAGPWLPCRSWSRRRPGACRWFRPTRCRPSLADLGPSPRRIVANLPYNVSTALLVALAAPGGRRRRHGADVPEGGGRPAGGPAAQQGLRPALGAGPACLRRAAPVRRGALGLRPAAQGHLVGRAADAPILPTVVWPICSRWKGLPPLPSGNVARCCAAPCGAISPILQRSWTGWASRPPPGPRNLRWRTSCAWLAPTRCGY